MKYVLNKKQNRHKHLESRFPTANVGTLQYVFHLWMWWQFGKAISKPP